SIPEIREVLARSERHLAHPLLPEAATRIAEAVDGDLRTAISLAEVVAEEEEAQQPARIEELVAELAGFKLAIDSDTHYELASALIKSMRAGDDDGAIEYLARTLDLGEDPRFVARRVVIFASEDVGLADPKALMLATSGLQAIEAVGMPEARIILAHLVVYMARAPKSRESYDMLASAAANIDHAKAIPLHLAGKGGRIADELARRGKLHRE
ncbi:MAG: replication-associated recombination protein A, partial [Actinomycetota bacterium]|nr:replication-associated recombination protein A [Actinomycetota bacterium]